jgi:UDP-N-acetylmuramyl pentapeptide phosphotransferase/UDP-N-acetylglucosamine-1-phosphate transferase
MLNYLAFNIIFLFLLNLFLNNKKLLIHNTFGFKHKKKSKNIVLSGGLYFLISFFIISLLNDYIFMNLLIYSSIFLILGIFSDINLNFSARQRLIFMFIFAFFIIINAQLFINTVDIKILDIFLQYNIFSLIFFSLCFVIIINGANFIDGTNGNASGYFIFCFLSLSYQLDLISTGKSDAFILQLMLLPIIVFFIFNFFNKNYLGDNGSYFLSALTGLLVINFYIYYDISSFYFINLLLYPAIEVLISFVRKIYSKQSPYSPDQMHLHHLIEKSFSKIKFFKQYKNNVTSIIILIFLSIFFIQFNSNINDKLIQIKLTSTFCILYFFIYLLLRVFLKKNKLK